MKKLFLLLCFALVLAVAGPQPRAEAFLFANHEVEKLYGGLLYNSQLSTSYGDEHLLQLARQVVPLMPQKQRVQRLVFRVAKDDQLNAFCGPNGMVYVTEGLLQTMPENEVAAVIGHELGHSQYNHWGKLFEAKMLTALGTQYLANKGIIDETTARIGQAVLQIALSRGYGFADEYASDKHAFLCVSGPQSPYNPASQALALLRLQELEGQRGGASGGIENFIRPHPPLKNRLDYQAKLLEEWSGGKITVSPDSGTLRSDGKILLFPTSVRAGFVAAGWLGRAVANPGSVHASTAAGTLALNGDHVAEMGQQLHAAQLLDKLRTLGCVVDQPAESAEN